MRPTDALNIVILGDVVESRRIADRNEFGSRLRNTLESWAEASVLMTRFATVGIDQFSCVAKPEKGFASLLLGLYAGLRPQRARLAVARGPVDIGRGSNDPAEMDGLAFHVAAVLLEEIEEKEIGLGFAGFGLLDPSLRATGILLSDAVDGWTDRQASVVLSVREHGDQVSAARALGVSPQVVSKQAKATRFAHVEEVLREIDGSIELSRSLPG